MAHDQPGSCILSSMRGRGLLEIGVAVATALSVGLLGLMLASPWLPQAADAPSPQAFEPSGAPSATPEGEQPPIGLYLLRGAFSFGPCLAIELSAESYPVAEDAEGSATVLWWQRGMTGCDARTGEIHEVSAAVARDLAEDDGHLIGYALDFVLPLDVESEQRVAAQITILAAQSTADLLQALDTSAGSSGFGLVLDRVSAVDPPLNPLPSATPLAAVPPSGIFVMQGPLDAEGPCLVIELGEPSYPADPSADGAARVRSWQPSVRDPSDPAQCLYRRGDVDVTEGSVAVALDSSGTLVAFDITFSVPVEGTGASRTIELSFDAAQRSPDHLEAAVLEPDLGVRIFDRVDSIEPPLGPPPSASPGG
jgi:hypothetical protein